ncbi:hypothetical protein SS50377_20969 [Spironucleus salmonicida]|uniref:Uncharacterized protein n=1 Tax=Spironucleus salmonicida TaxID=348837 RepID=V6LS83_9EUKA|nr:hypothetical protein SS50377_20969 [Spironucleus salmonicida]|eukprot:EST43639.1 Hypothetical protein SS50377_16682 [Spironucleus salmonicida]
MIQIDFQNDFKGFIQVFRNTIYLAFTKTECFYNMATSSLNKKIHNFDVVYGECGSSYSILSKMILNQVQCDELIIQGGQPDLNKEELLTVFENVVKLLS